MTMNEQEAKMVGYECPNQLIEIVHTYHGRTGKASARRACSVPQFLIDHGDGRLSVAQLTERPK